MARVVILGKGGHAKSLQHVLSWADILLENDDDVRPDDQVYIGVGDLETRRRLFEKFSAQIPYRGVQQMGNTWVGPDVQTGVNVLINTGAPLLSVGPLVIHMINCIMILSKNGYFL